MPAADPLLGRVLGGKYRVVELLGRGGMGAVYKALNEGLGSYCAIKILNARAGRISADRARFVEEAKAAASSSHPNVVRIFDIASEPGEDCLYIVMEFLEGESLRELLRRRVRLDVAETVRILLPLMRAVLTYHERGIIHRDLKPENIFLHRGAGAEPPVPKVLDFGIAKMVQSHEDERGDGRVVRTEDGVWVGSIGYTPLDGSGNASLEVDLFSFGVLLYECLDGVNPFLSPVDPKDVLAYATRLARMDDHVEPLERKLGLRLGIDGIIRKLLSLEPTARYASLAEAVAELAPFEQPAKVVDSPRNTLVAALVAAIILMITALTVVSIQSFVPSAPSRAEGVTSANPVLAVVPGPATPSTAFPVPRVTEPLSFASATVHRPVTTSGDPPRNRRRGAKSANLRASSAAPLSSVPPTPPRADEVLEHALPGLTTTKGR